MKIIEHPKEKRMFPKNCIRISEKYKFLSKCNIQVAKLTNHLLKDYYLPYLVNGEFSGIFAGKQRVYGYETPKMAFDYGKELVIKYAKLYKKEIAWKTNQQIPPLDIDKMAEKSRKDKRDEIPVKPQGYRGAGEHKFKGDQ